LEVAPDDPSAITSVVLALADADPEARSDAVNRAAATLSGHVAALVRFGDGLWRQSFPDCELMGARLLLEALRSDPRAPGAVEGIASALAYIASTEDARPVVEEALRLSGNNSGLLSAWTRRLDRAQGPAAAVPALPRGSQYGPCRCSGTFEQREIEVRFRIQEETVVLDDVPQGVCPSCGTKVYKANVLAAIETLMKSSVAAPRE
jgi:YgiT-type zinc finger domain-containing protein